MSQPNRTAASSFTLPFLLALVSLPTSAGAQELDLRERWRTMGNEEAGYFSVIGGVAVNAGGDIWVVDGLTHRVMVFGPDGDYRETAAPAGDGPGEVSGPTLLARRPGARGVAVYDISRPGVDLFGPSGEFEDRVHLEAMVQNPKGFHVLEDGSFVLSGGIAGREGAIHWFTADGELETSRYPLPEADRMRASLLVAGGALAPGSGESLWFSRSAPHAIYRFDHPEGDSTELAADRELLESIANDFIHEEGSGAGSQRTFRWDFPRSVWIGELPSGDLLNVVWYQEEGRSLWERYRPSGELVSRTAVDTPYRPFTMAPDGDVLASLEREETGEQLLVRLELGPAD